jgi:hypothetical protein
MQRSFFPLGPGLLGAFSYLDASIMANSRCSIAATRAARSLLCDQLTDFELADGIARKQEAHAR